MEQFQRHDPTTQRPVMVELLDTVRSDNRWDEYREVRLRLDDGRSYSAAFWRDPQSRSSPCCEEPGMVLVRDLTTDDLLAALEEILRQGAAEETFEPLVDM